METIHLNVNYGHVVADPATVIMLWSVALYKAMVLYKALVFGTPGARRTRSK